MLRLRGLTEKRYQFVRPSMGEETVLTALRISTQRIVVKELGEHNNDDCWDLSYPLRLVHHGK